LRICSVSLVGLGGIVAVLATTMPPKPKNPPRPAWDGFAFTRLEALVLSLARLEVVRE